MIIKYSLLFLLLCSSAKAQKTDTVKVVLMVSDTSDKVFIYTDYNRLTKTCDTCFFAYKKNKESYKNSSVFWIDGYEVREVVESRFETMSNRNFTLPNGSVTLMGTVPQWETQKLYSHKSYLNAEKRQLPKSLIIWQKL